MPKATNTKLIAIFAVGVSLLGLFVTLMIGLQPPISRENCLWRKPLIGSIFSLICVLGIAAAVFPKKCSQAFHLQRREKDLSAKAVSMEIKGHHPDCEKFSAHVIHTSEHTLCAACTGLSLGGFIALVGTGLYFFGGWHVQTIGFLEIAGGVVGVIMGFLQLKFRWFIRLMLNTFFVLGAFLILMGIDKLAESLFVDLFMIFLIVFWLMTRITLSQWDHWKTCHNCESPCEIRRIKKK